GLALLVARPARARGEGARLRARAAQLREGRAQVTRTPGAQPARQGAGARGRRRLALRVERDRRVPGGALPAHAAPAARPGGPRPGHADVARRPGTANARAAEIRAERSTGLAEEVAPPGAPHTPRTSAAVVTVARSPSASTRTAST